MRAVFLITLASVLLWGCAKEPLRNLTQDEGQLYITNHDSSVNFSAFSTFNVADSVAIVDNNQYAGRDRANYDAALIDAIITQMQARGYTLVPRTSNPDLAITVSRVYNTSVGVVDYGNYWGGYGDYWGSDYWGYGGYDYYFPGSIGVYQTTEGAVTLDMFDLKDAAANNEIKYVWNGLIRGSGSFTTSKATTHAESLFSQSTYIRKN